MNYCATLAIAAAIGLLSSIGPVVAGDASHFTLNRIFGVPENKEFGLLDVVSRLSPTGDMVVDGDFLTMQGKVAKIVGIDAPELIQSCTRFGEPWQAGIEAAKWLRQFLRNRQVVCVIDGDLFNYKAYCTYSDDIGVPRDLGLKILGSGWAYLIPVDEARWQRAPINLKDNLVSVVKQRPDYVLAAKSARANKIGLWSGRCEPPWDWRYNNPELRPNLSLVEATKIVMKKQFGTSGKNSPADGEK
jgi:endonuclease YncB( thermonuclease family)